MARAGLFGLGILFIVIAIGGYIIPLNVTLAGTTHTIAIPQGVAFCNSGMGQFSQLLAEVVKFCSEFEILLYGVYGSGVLGIILIIIGAVIPSKLKQKKLTCSYCNFIAISETELEKHNSEKHLDKSPYVCEHCDFIGISEEILWNHYNDDHPDKKKWKWN